MPTCDDIILLARYNACMNRRVYDAAASLAPEAVSAERGAYFGSLLGTLNHLVAGDSIWLRRFASHPTGFAALDAVRGASAPTSLTHSFGDTLADVREHRMRLDGTISALAGELRQPDLDQVLTYRNSRGDAFQRHFGSLLLHFFNHQTHHRGQASTLLSQAGVDIGVTDLLQLIAELNVAGQDVDLR